MRKSLYTRLPKLSIMLILLIITGLQIISLAVMEAKELMKPITVHYYRYDGDYTDWTIWTWNSRTNSHSKEVKAISQDTTGLVFQLSREEYGENAEIGLLPKYKDWQEKDAPDRTWQNQLGDSVWIIQNDPKLYTQNINLQLSLRSAQLDTPTEIKIQLWKSLTKNQLSLDLFTVRNEKGNKLELAKIELIPPLGSKSRAVLLKLAKPFNITEESVQSYQVEMKGYKSVKLTYGKILDSPHFYSDEQLGTIYAPQETLFRVFAPTASLLSLNLYDAAVGGKAKTYAMKPKPHGIWEISVKGNLANKYYTLTAKGIDPRFHQNRELIDPYSRSNTAHNGRAIIVHDETPVTGRPKFDLSQAIVYELHLRDFTIDPHSGVAHKGKYIGLTETGTTIPGHPDIHTALDHLTELGVNAVQIMPFQDFENDESKDNYNWGYMPIHFDSPDGWYATKRDDATRVKEVKKMIDALHKKGIKVIMDVVYNHTAENNDSQVFSFNGLVPGYYYRLRADGSFWNGSGTGNEFRSEAPMGRKYIIDSLKYWVTEYKVDGFRFDLMGLIDLETMTQAASILHQIDPDIFIYGEPWAAGETPIQVTDKGKQKDKGFSVFNDDFRNALKGSPFDRSKGFVVNSSNLGAVKKGVLGSITDFTDSPQETLNYMECHDNRTLWDRLVYVTIDDPAITDSDRIAMDKLGAVILFTSQGVPFIQAGQEFLRTKGGEENSYNKPDSVNQIDWMEKVKNADVFHYYQGLIALRKNHPMLRFKTKEDVLANVKFLDDDLKIKLPANCLGFKVTRGNSEDVWKEIMVLVNPNKDTVSIPIPTGPWKVAVNNREANNGPVSGTQSVINTSQVSISSRSVMVLFRE